MDTFGTYLPHPALAPYVRYYWTLAIDDVSTTKERVTPTGCMQLVFHRGERMQFVSREGMQPRSFICGQSTGFTDVATTGRLSMLVVVFQPYGAKAFFSLAMDELKGEDISVHDLGDRLLTELEDRIMNIEDDRIAIELIESFLIKWLYLIKEYNLKRILPAIRMINKENEVSIATLSETSCLSYKQFNRIFSEYVGVNPKEFARIVRFQRALYTLQMNPSMDFTTLALECGYYDQSHLIKDFKTFSGYTPSEYLAVCTPYSDYFSLP